MIEAENQPIAAEAQWDLRLDVAGRTRQPVAALANLGKVGEESLAGKSTLEVVDLMVDPALARGDQIVAIPTLVRKLLADGGESSATSRTPSACW